MAYTPCLRPAWPSHLTESGLSSKFRREKIKCKCLSEIWLIVTYGKEMKFTYGNEMKSTESRRCHCAFRGVVSGCVSQAQTHTQRRVAQGLTGHILQPVHSQRPMTFVPREPMGTKSTDCHRGRGACGSVFPVNTELPARIQDACRERRETDPHRLTPGPSDLFTDTVLAQESGSQQADSFLRLPLIR